MKLILTIILQSVISALAVTAESGDTLASVNPGAMMVPASNMKLVTTGLALDRLGEDFRWETTLAYSGEIENGTLRGDLYIIGGGDPTLGSKDTIATGLDLLFAQWKAMVRRAGIERIDGSVVGDGRLFEGPMEDPTWEWQDLGTYYGAGASGLNFYENMKDFKVAPGDSLGSPVRWSDAFPETPWMTYSWRGTTGPAGTGDRLYLYTSRLAPVGVIDGTFAIDRRGKILNCANKFPEYTCAWYFARSLAADGIFSSGGAADAGPATFFSLPPERLKSRGELTTIGRTLSPSLSRVVFETNHISNNVYAEVLYRTMLVRGLYPTLSAGIRQQDGSGLSSHNLVSPAFLCAFLRSMMPKKCFAAYLRSLPQPGRPGTVQPRLPKAAPEDRARVRMKSGSMDGVRCWSGYILPREEGGRTVIFSYMVNNNAAPTSEVNAALDSFLTELL